MPYHLDDRTFKGYELYSAEVQRRIDAAEKRADAAEKTAKTYKERQNICIAMFISGALMIALSTYFLIGRDICECGEIPWRVCRIH
jgi:hypothetical protein